VRFAVLAAVVSFGLTMAVSASGADSKSSASIPAFSVAQLSAPAGANWILQQANVQSWRYSALSQIDGSNGGNLKLAWSTHLATPASPEKLIGGNANPIVYNGVMYAQDGWSRITALDGASGKILWQFDPQIALNAPLNYVSNRSIGMGDGMIFTGAYGTLYAINAQTGAQVWATQIVNPIGGGGITVSPLYYKGLVIIGTTGGDWGGACIQVALDAKTGAVKWHFNNIPSNPKAPGWNTWPAKWYYFGGAAIWDMQSINPKLDMVYAGTGQPLPFNGLINGPGSEFGTDGVYALHALTGKFAWFYQEVHHDIWDYDGMETPIVETLTINGQKRDAVVHINKNAYYFVLDPATGKPMIPAPEMPVPQEPLAHTYPTQPIPQNTSQELVPHVPPDPQDYQGIIAPNGKPYKISTVPYVPYTDQEYVVVSPTAGGGVEWPMGSWDPVRGVEVVCANVQSFALNSPPAADQHPVISNAGQIIQWRTSTTPNSLSIARLVAFNPGTNSIVWKHDEVSTGGIARGNATPCASPVTTTASGLSIIGRTVATAQYPNGVAMIQAFDTGSGALKWQIPVLVNGQAVPTVPRITPYMANGKEYIVAFTHFATLGPDVSAYALP
jgi:alcohol dehydrogenase (cytochrome c)